MTRKDYIFFADRIKAMKVGIERHGDIVLRCTFEQWVETWCDHLKRDNPNFDKSRFLTACGL